MVIFQQQVFTKKKKKSERERERKTLRHLTLPFIVLFFNVLCVQVPHHNGVYRTCRFTLGTDIPATAPFRKV
jgi:hypothetical protein